MCSFAFSFTQGKEEAPNFTHRKRFFLLFLASAKKKNHGCSRFSQKDKQKNTGAKRFLSPQKRKRGKNMQEDRKKMSVQLKKQTSGRVEFCAVDVKLLRSFAPCRQVQNRMSCVTGQRLGPFLPFAIELELAKTKLGP